MMCLWSAWWFSGSYPAALDTDAARASFYAVWVALCVRRSYVQDVSVHLRVVSSKCNCIYASLLASVTVFMRLPGGDPSSMVEIHVSAPGLKAAETMYLSEFWRKTQCYVHTF